MYMLKYVQHSTEENRKKIRDVMKERMSNWGLLVWVLGKGGVYLSESF